MTPRGRSVSAPRPAPALPDAGPAGSGFREWFTASELAGLAGMPGTVFRTRDWLTRHGVKSRVRAHGKGLEYHLSGLPAATQAVLFCTDKTTDKNVCATSTSSTTSTPSTPSTSSTQRPPSLDRMTDAVRAEAGRRAAACLDVADRVAAGMSRASATAAAAADRAIPPATLKNWLRRVQNAAPAEWAARLAPGRGGARRDRADFSPEAWEYLKADYLRPERPCLATCYWRLERIARERGWTVPSYRTVARRVGELDWQMVTLAREGEKGLLRKLPAMTRTRGHLCALQAVNADGHRFDVMCKLPSGAVGRPMLTAWQDLYSGKILAWRLSETLNQHHVRLSFGDMVERYGVPAHAFLDNGREFANKWMSGQSPFRFRFKIKDDDPVGIFLQLGVTVHWTTPYHGQSKPIERAFKDLCETIAKHPACRGAYTGNSPVTKPDNYGSRVFGWDDFCALVDAEIEAHNARTGRRTETARGRSFDETFNESYARSTVTRTTAEQRRLWLLAAEGVTVRGTGHVAILGNAYWGEALAPLAGRRVVVRFDPEHLDRPVSVYDADGALLCEAQRTIAAFDDADAAKEHQRANRRRIKAAKEQLNAERDMAALEAAAVALEKTGTVPGAACGTGALAGPCPGDIEPAAVRILPPRRRAVNAEDCDPELPELVRKQEQRVLDMAEAWMREKFAL
ncbi:MAG: transposase [Candidatus Hydrogenedens sp.]|nr:Mu transposase C-terminal domain-containing protein [Candidatus Hydrogenedentota bacterium]NLF56553.1 transposase [Candidatus Hydrogenedens sp.]